MSVTKILAAVSIGVNLVLGGMLLHHSTTPAPTQTKVTGCYAPTEDSVIDDPNCDYDHGYWHSK